VLPLQLKLRDPMGQAKSGRRLPRPIDATGGEPVFDPPSRTASALTAHV
jgi:hypothetical protein